MLVRSVKFYLRIVVLGWKTNELWCTPCIRLKVHDLPFSTLLVEKKVDRRDSSAICDFLFLAIVMICFHSSKSSSTDASIVISLVQVTVNLEVLWTFVSQTVTFIHFKFYERNHINQKLASAKTTGHQLNI